MKATSITSLLVLFIALHLPAQTNRQWPRFPEARVTARVVGEDGNPIPEVRVSFFFGGLYDPNQTLTVTGNTDAQGIFSGQGHTLGRVGASIEKEGYYGGSVRIPAFREREGDRWLPWDTTNTAILREIKNPAAMYAKSAWVQVPELNQRCGYDLEVGDWVSPWGRGNKSDFIFLVKTAYTNITSLDALMDLSFSNPLDGIQPAQLPLDYADSAFSWPRLAPEDGYFPSWRTELGLPLKGYWHGGAPTNRVYRIQDVERERYYFRVRTVVNDNKIVSALYGKLCEGFQLAPENRTKCGIRLCYYLNPTTLDRNMEFDLSKNLFKNLTHAQQPRRP